MSVIRKISQWAARTGGAFLRGGVQQQAEEPEYELNQGVTEAYEAADPAVREKIDPFNHGNGKYGGRQVYRSREEREREEAERLAQEAASQQQYVQDQAAQYQQAQYQQQYAQEQYAQEQMQQTGTYQAQQYQPQYAQEQMQQTGTYQAQQYQQPQQYAQEQMQQTGVYQAQQYQPQYAQDQTAYQAQQYQQPRQQYAQDQAAYQAQQYQPQQYAQEQAAYQNQQAQASNVVTFPGMHTGADGRVYAHVEYIIQMTRRQDCRQIIEYIRANASVFLNMETINSAERQRCVDVLSGAAFALGCRLHKIALGGIYLISSPSVQVMADNATQMLSDPDNARNFARQRYEEPAQSHPERAEQQPEPSAEAAPESMPEDSRKTGFSSGSPTMRFRSQGSRSLAASYGTVAAGTYSGTFPAVSAH